MTTRAQWRAPEHTSEWPYSLDVGALRGAGWRPTPLRQFVLKLASRCNLACNHCYLYEMADQTWRDQPARMSAATLTMAAQRIAEHAELHGLPGVRLVLHGGEPLLVGADHLARALGILRAAIEPVTVVDLSVQTNALLLTDEVIDVLAEHRVRVGVSLDGRAEDHDRRRQHRDGRGSHAEVAAALHRLRSRADELFVGVLCTMDLANDPLPTYEALLAFDPPEIDFLLPHGNWSSPPPLRGSDPASTPYADWLIGIFDHWYARPRVTGIRLFEEIISLALGGASRTEAIGLSPVGLVVINTDGALEQVDVLRSVAHGAAATGLDIHADSLDRVLDHPAIVARQLGREGLSNQCRACRMGDVCGGGFYPHRYRAGRGYLNPSVYCPDLLRLTEHIGTKVQGDVQALVG